MTARLEELWAHDPIELGMLADAERRRIFPGGIVTYSLNREIEAAVLMLSGVAPDFAALEGAPAARSILPVCAPGRTAVEYLKFVALCRLALPASHIQVDARRSGLKVAQIALRFGADDFGTISDHENGKPGILLAEEDVRRVIRDAGFLPKRRSAAFDWLGIS